MTNMSHEDTVHLVTGATSGIGLATAVALAARGARVLIGARTVESGRTATAAVTARVPDADLAVVTADLSDMTQVRALADRVRTTTDRLDGLILNAAEVRTTRQTTVDGFETNFATNHLSGFLLTQELLPLLEPRGRIVAVSSSNHRQIKAVDLDALPAGDGFHHMRNYSTTKLLTVLFVAEFARRHTDPGVTANAADPGFVRTNLGRHATGAFGLFLTAARPFQSSPDKAAATPVYLATSPDVAGVNGGYYAKCRPATPSPLSQDPATGRALWDLSLGLLART